MPSVATATATMERTFPEACQVNPQDPSLLRFMGWVDGSWVQGQAGVGQESDCRVLVLAYPLDALDGGVGDLGERRGWQVGELDVFEVGPQVFDRVELGRIGREPLDGEPVALATQPGPHAGAPVRGEPVPDEHHPRAGVERPKLLQDRDEGVGVVAGLLQVKTKPGRGASRAVAEGGGHGGLLPAVAVAQGRRGAPWGPSAAHRWDQRDGRFVEEDDPG